MVDRNKVVSAATAGATVTIIFLTLITVMADFQPALKDWLKSTFTHHWIGKGILAVVVFLIVWLTMLAQKRQPDDQRLSVGLMTLTWTAVLGTVVLFGFFVFETLT